MKQITKTNWTVNELRDLDGYKCLFQWGEKPEAEGEIYVLHDDVHLVTNNDNYAGGAGKKKEGWKYSWVVYDTDCKYINNGIITLIVFYPHDEKDNIYYDDNGDEIRVGDEVEDELGKKMIFLGKIPRKSGQYICTNASKYDPVGKNSYTFSVGHCFKCKSHEDDEKKERKLYMTDREWAEFAAKNNIAL